ncbi:MAG: hypothetical protein A3I60_00560 [Sulfuricurvum sp. RIFCSPLOWO2_02_FULL_43_45]|nr:MAG: hypothetical protein A3I60_00560 [Sulfuricurvum sp. RIFCSPLOWO2_02_FULL_43_45]
MKIINFQVESEHLKILLNSSKIGVISSLLLGLVLMYAERNIDNSQVVIIWFVFLFLISLIRISIITAYQNTPDTNAIFTRQRLRNLRIATLVSAVIWGSIGVLLFSSSDFDHLIFLLIIIAGLTAGNTLSNASDLPSNIGFSLLTLLPITICLLLDQSTLSSNIGIALLLYFGFLVFLARSINASMTQSFILQQKAIASEQEAKLREERYRLILQHTPAGIFHFNRELVITYCNDRFAQLLKAPKESLIGLDMNTLKDQRILPALSEAIEGKDGSYEGEYLTTISNTLLWLILFYAPLRDANGSIEGGIAIIEDITERKRSEEESKKLLNNLRQAEKIAHLGNWHFDISSNTLEWSDEIFNIFELDQATFNPTYEAFLNVIHPDDREKVANAYERSLTTKEKYEIIHRLLMRDGKIKYVSEQCETKFDSDGQPLYSLGTVQDITQQMHYQIRLENSENTLKYLLKMSPIAVRIAKNEGQEVIFANEAYARLIQADVSDVLGKNPKNYYADQEKYHEIVSQIKNNEIIYNQLVELSVNNETIWVLASYMPIEFEGISCVLGWFYDITKEKNLQTKLMEHSQRLEYLAHYDALTGLPNRILESDRLYQGMIQTLRRGKQLAVLYLDLDGFKAVNDNYGHPVGDQLLIALSARMKQSLREGDTLSRLGGDEFVAILVDLDDTSAALPIIGRLLEAASQPIHLGDLVIQVSASIGVTFFPQDDEVNGDQLIRQADQAMYVAKQSGKNRYHVFDSKQDQAILTLE